MGAGELQYTFTAESVFEGFFTDGAFAPDKGSLTTVPGAVDIHDTGHVARIRGTNGQTTVGTVYGGTVYGRTTEGAKRAKGGTSGGIRTRRICRVV